MSESISRVYNILNSFSFLFKLIYSKETHLNEKSILEFKENILKSGPIYIKFCQLITQRDDIFNCNDLLKTHLISLQDNCPYHDFSETEKLFKLNFPSINIEDYFDYINPVPIASGSISQIYQTILKDDDKFSILKIKHKNIEKKINDNIIEFKILLELFRKARYSFMDAINFDNFFDGVKQQLNYVNEVEITKEFNLKTKNIYYLSCPEIIRSSNDIIIQSFETGLSYNKFIEKYPNLSIKAKIIALKSLFYMVFVLRISHADCHNGNILYSLKEDDEIHITFIDFGFSNKITKEERDSFGNLLKSVNFRNKNLFFESILNCCNNNTKLELILDKLKNFDLDIFFTIKSKQENLNSFCMIKDAMIILKNQNIEINNNILNILINMALIVENFDHDLEYTIFDYCIYDILENDKTNLNEMFTKIIDLSTFNIQKNNFKEIKKYNKINKIL
jgi:ubiquinone biosynthesis protein